MIKTFDEITARLRAETLDKRKIGVIAAQDEHTLEAVMLAAREGLTEPVLIGKKGEITAYLGSDASNYEIIDIDDPFDCAVYAARLVREGKIDCIIKGGIETGQMMKALVNREYGIREHETLSHISFYESPYYHKLFASTDGALLMYPTLEQKVGEIENAVRVFHKLGTANPKVAALAAVDSVNEKMRDSVEAAQLKAIWQEGKIPDCIVEGPITYDIALQKEAAEIKGFDSPVAGDADILLFPEIMSGNLLLKALSVTGGAKFAGGVFGAMVPIVLTSRSMPTRDKYLSIILNLLIGKL